MCAGHQFLISIQDKHPVAARVLQGVVASVSEVVVPFKIIHLRAMFAGNFNRAIGGAGVDHDNLVGNVFHRGKRLADEFLLILDNHAYREA